MAASCFFIRIFEWDGDVLLLACLTYCVCLARRLGNLEAREIAEELANDSDTHDLWLGSMTPFREISIHWVYSW